MNKKLDPELRARLRAHRELNSRFEDAPSNLEMFERTELIVEFTGDLEDLKATGFVPRTVIEHPEEGYKIATGTIPVEQLEDLAAIEHVVDMEGPRRYYPLLDYSLDEVRAVAVHNGSPARKGAGVVIGVIDSGIDWRHGVFVNPIDQTSRLLGIWDQMLTAKSGETKGPEGLGVVYTQAELNNGLKGTANIRTRDKNARGETSGHGTHVASIAAGNGRAPIPSQQNSAYEHIGVAPNGRTTVREGSQPLIGSSALAHVPY